MTSPWSIAPGGFGAEPVPESRHRDDIPLSQHHSAASLAHAVEGCYWSGGTWMLPHDSDHDAATAAAALFPDAVAGSARLRAMLEAAASAAAPIDTATASYEAEGWTPSRIDEQAWPRTVGRMLREGKYPHQYQRVAAAFAARNAAAGRGAYVALSPGAGKTFVAAMALEAAAPERTLIVAPSSVKPEWLRMFPDAVVAGPGTDGLREALEGYDDGVLVIHYETLRLAGLMPAWRAIKWDAVVLDEAHRAASHKAIMVKELMRIARSKPRPQFLLLSGTVMQGNNVERLYVPMFLMDPVRFKTRWQDWNDKYVRYIETPWSKIPVGPLPAAREELRRVLGEYMVVVNVDHAPEHTRHEHVVDMLPAQRDVYDELSADLLAEFPDGSIVAAQPGAGLLTKLRGITAGVPLANDGYASAKRDKAVELWQDGGCPPAVFFTVHRELAGRLAAYLNAMGVRSAVASGGSAKVSDAAVRAFRDGTINCLVATIGKLREGVNLQRAEMVIMLEEDWSPANNMQAIARVVRQGQQSNAAVHVIRCVRSVDLTSVLPRTLSKSALRGLVTGLSSAKAKD